MDVEVAAQTNGGRLALAVDLAAQAVEAAEQHARIGRPLRRVFLQQLADQDVEIGGDLLYQARGSIETGVDVLVQQLGRLAGERRPTRQQHVQDDAERIEIAAPRHRLTQRLLWRQILRRADDAAGDRQVRAGEQAGDAEVGKLDTGVRSQETGVRRNTHVLADSRLLTPDS